MKRARQERGWTQTALARHLGVSQGYVSLLESEGRPVPGPLAERLVNLLNMPPTALPHRAARDPLDAAAATSAVGALGHPGLAHLRSGARLNPAELLLRTLSSSSLEARTFEALPWVVRTHPDLDWAWLVPEAKRRDLQNRLGFVVSLARGLAERSGDQTTAQTLRAREDALEPSVLRKEDAVGGAACTESERRWLREHRPPEAARWNVLSNLTAEALDGE